MPLMPEEYVREKLPKVGDVVYRTPTLHKALGQCRNMPRRRGVVTYVHEEHMWYTVRFDCGYSESYKLPEVEETEE